ncbi:complement C1q tumor necrosis factor-related protein 3-like isoform X1 [Scomber japonicus]|uniref:complement C1q tumor necrosis factor-related protein 3-like isoform X1 n=1 Tax=Scomber japonicus TaxID=13676 RepID=UPI00230669FB|nr:complement C1q tumor necrosis factor-related protein 3-like isoform X1 [Scomber japonicus]
MTSAWFLVLVVYGLVGVQAFSPKYEFEFPTPEGLTPEPGKEDVYVLLSQLLDRVEKLERKCEDRGKSQVAFSASLFNTEKWTHYGPFDSETRLVFEKVTTNVGNAYDNTTGVFTAPVKGLYYVRLTCNVGDSGSLNTAVMKNGENMFAIFNTLGLHSSGSNGMTLVLEEGDRLEVFLWPTRSVFDQSRLSTFSGFLVFPM